MSAITHREAVRRQHRQLALFLALQCWMRGVDGVTLEKEAIVRLLGMDRWEPDRIPMLQDDLREIFPHQRVREGTREGVPYSLDLSRLEAPPTGRARDWPNLEIIAERPVVFADLEKTLSKAAPFLLSRGAFCEQLISLYLGVTSQGNVSPTCWNVFTEEED